MLYLDRLAPYELRRYRRCLAVSARQYAVRDESRPGREDDSVGQVCVSAVPPPPFFRRLASTARAPDASVGFGGSSRWAIFETGRR